MKGGWTGFLQVFGAHGLSNRAVGLAHVFLHMVAGVRISRFPTPTSPNNLHLFGYDFLRTCSCILKTAQGWLYRTTVIDLETRMVVSWTLSSRMTADIAVYARECAKGRGYVAEGAIFHSDKSSRYTSWLLLIGQRRTMLAFPTRALAIATTTRSPSLSLPSLKRDAPPSIFCMRDAAPHAVIESTEDYCSRARPHSTIDYKIPAEVMQGFFDRTVSGDEEVVMAA